jgi:hypothetical protein
MKKIIFLLFVLVFSMNAFGQMNINPYFSIGYLNHMGRNGYNVELGADREVHKLIDVSANARFSWCDSDLRFNNQTIVLALALNVSFIALNNESMRLMIGPGLSYGNYQRHTAYVGIEKNGKTIWIDYAKIRFDYKLDTKTSVGMNAALYGDGGNLSIMAGFVASFKL